jgi:hypothetical protein
MVRRATMTASIFIRMSGELRQWFRDEAKQRGVRPSDLYRMALAQFMGRSISTQVESDPAAAFDAAFCKKEAA